MAQALADLTGGIAMNISIKKMQADVRSGSLWKKLLEYRDAGYLMGCGAFARDFQTASFLYTAVNPRSET